MNTRRWIALGLTIMLLLFLIPTTSAQSEGIQIKDPALEAFIRREIAKPEGPIMHTDVESLRSIDTTT